MRARRPSAPLHPTVVLWMAVGLARLLPAALVRPSTAASSAFAGSSTAGRSTRTWRRRSSSSLQGEKLWLAPLGAILLLPLLAWGRDKPDPAFGRLLVVIGALGLAWLLLQGFAIGLRGWRYDWLDRALRRARRPPVRHGLRRAAVPRSPSCSCSPSASPRAARSAATSSSSARSASSSRRSSLFVFMPIVQMLANALRHRGRRLFARRLPREAVQRPALGARLPDRRPALRRRLELASSSPSSSACSRRCSASSSRWSSPAPASASAASCAR